MASGPSRSRPGRGRTVLVMGVTGVAILAASYMANGPGGDGGGLTSVVLSGRPSGPAPEAGKPAPDFKATTTAGRRVALSRLKGRPVWLTFGATWCQPCRAENPDIEAAYERYRAQGLLVLAIYIQDDATTIREYAERTGITFPMVDDEDTSIAAGYRILGIPSHFFVDASGVLRVIRIGSLDPAGIEENLQEIGVDVE